MLRHVKLIGKNMIAQGLGTAGILGFTILATRKLSIADYGELRYVMTLLPLLAALTLPGYDSIILRQANLRRPIPMLPILGIRVAGGLLASIFIFLTLLFLPQAITPSLRFFLISSAVLLPLHEVATGYRNYLIGRGLRNRSLDLVLLTRFLGLGFLGLGIGVISVLQLNWLFLYPIYLLGNILSNFFAFGRVTLKRLRVRVARSGPKEIRPALLVTLSGLVYTLGYSIDRLGMHQVLGSEALAFYAVLTMIPLEVARLIDTITPLYYRDLFYRGAHVGRSQIIFLLSVLIALVIGYTLSFHFFSAAIFGQAYKYQFHQLILAGMLIATLSVEYFCAHRVFVLGGSVLMLTYSLSSLVAGLVAVAIGLYVGGVESLLIALLIKQLSLPLLFLELTKSLFEKYRKIDCS